MTDIALIWDDASFSADIGLANGDLVTDDGLRTSIYISLFTDAPAKADDVVPAGADRRGWWGDALAEIPGDITGSRLWLLKREKQLSSVMLRAQTYATEALQWLLDDKIAASVDVVVTNPARGILALSVTITRPSGPGRQTFDYLWEATA